MNFEAYIKNTGGIPFVICDYDAALKFIEQHSKRVLIYGPDQKAIHRALQLRKDGYALIALSKAILKSWKLEVGDLVQIKVEPDTSEFGMSFPEEFKIVLEQDPEAAEVFERLKPGRQRGVLHYVSQPKGEESRIKRALEMAEKMRTGTLHGGID
ncbi:YdeI/OmpD-associated family protein [Croceimicrobium hydrocarbonivorans]|uniref:YdeI/OmpD-associated family protein n=1 Tax=Croceimicrobium hydrocarbonivorans TaxID=2761580 RepID=A0A7H0VH18_9FLAO|nr:YdeI/OmpD-associated family protein [Croceimicrobium hydrocarbonivorans]QNR25016.1 YdeI/OmpD-associated family protein [Croceimicrobium hydrocarbonivorans]